MADYLTIVEELEMRIPISQIDAFRQFKGNPSVACPLEVELAMNLMQKIAAKNKEQ